MIKYTNKYTDKSFDIDKCRKSAESGYAPAQYQLGQCYEEGAGVERNLAKAFRYSYQLPLSSPALKTKDVMWDSSYRDC